MKKVLENQLYLYRLSLKASPRLFGFHIFICLELGVFVFLEYTVWMGYNLSAVEKSSSFDRVVLLTLGICLVFVFHQLLDSVYFHWARERIKPILVRALRNQINEKAVGVNLSWYEDTGRYQDIFLCASQAEQCMEQFFENSFRFMRNMDVILIWLVYLLFKDRAGLLAALACFLIEVSAGCAYHSAIKRQQTEMAPVEQKRGYPYRAFYKREYAKEMRIHPELGPRMEQEFDRCSDRLEKMAGKYSSRRWFWGLIKDYVPLYLIIYGGYLFWLLWQVMEEQSLSMAGMVILLAVVRRMTKRCGDLVDLMPEISSNSAMVEKIRAFLREETETESGQLDLEGSLESLTLSHVYFTYENGEEALHDINMEIGRGQKIALVGHNGAGKTTLIKLLMRLYDPKSGTICRNGVDIRSLKVKDYQKEIGAVFQDYKMYAATLRENVVMGDCSMSRQETYEVERALYRAGFLLTDSRMKYQIETPLTSEFEKDGVNLSAGESQKVAIARILYGNQEVIILDEPFNALDPSVEYRLNQELKRLAGDKTVIFISNRLTAAREADRIYMMEAGRIVEQGTHAQLLALGGAYRRMWELQAQGYRQ